jgi:hypothetical protein
MYCYFNAGISTLTNVEARRQIVTISFAEHILSKLINQHLPGTCTD